MQPGAGHPLALSAKLIDPEQRAKEQAAAVAVRVTGIQLVDPTAVKEQPQPGQGHLQYQVDDGPVIATAATTLSFHELKIWATHDHRHPGRQ